MAESDTVAACDRQAPREQQIAAVRRFNRDYTRRIGALGAGHLDSPFSLTEARVLYELAHWPRHGERPTANDLGGLLGLDAGYLSRILARFAKDGLIERKTSSRDARQTLLAITRAGRAAFAQLDRRAHDDVNALLNALPSGAPERLVGALDTASALLGFVPAADAGSTPAYTLRAHRPGDMGWVTHRHGVLYAEEYGWDARFEGLVAGIVADFIANFDPAGERCWIAEKDGAIIGSVFLVRKSKTVAKLRLLLVEPGARGLGLGAHLVQECEDFARSAGYRKIMLWTNSILGSARHIYQKRGYQLVESAAHHSFGHDLVGETWERKL